MLRLGGLGAFGGGRLAFGDFAAEKTSIAFFEFGERGIGIDGDGWMVSGEDQYREAEQTDGSNEREFRCDVHLSWVIMTAKKE